MTRHRKPSRRAKPADGLTVRERVFVVLAPGETLTRREIEAETGLPQPVVSCALWSLRRMGIVLRVGAGQNSAWQRVRGATAPVDTRGRSHASLRNLTPGDAGKLRALHMEWRRRGSPGAPPRAARPAHVMLEAWALQCATLKASA